MSPSVTASAVSSSIAQSNIEPSAVTTDGRVEVGAGVADERDCPDVELRPIGVVLAGILQRQVRLSEVRGR